ncbi:MAG: hypothetical protein HOP12_09470 [Candidatus Eisenbacteria bacterium]|uniref:Flagellar hook-associated protein 2 C-terminal domain-containing protein n=1 Tax=Eiseniibacteriota bacterium TaxID=2212470 RepID=A0A849SQW8_UNCEI|nr:hypothetical protein [Candidatus Eisenbacteria bacterium]
MIRGLFENRSLTAQLRAGLEEASATHRGISERVANALSASSSTDFSGELASRLGTAQQREADLEREMASLADTQLRYDADTRLLQEAYGRLRVTMRDRG